MGFKNYLWDEAWELNVSRDKVPGAMIQNIYPGQKNTSRIKNAQRYQPERLSWSD